MQCSKSTYNVWSLKVKSATTYCIFNCIFIFHPVITAYWQLDFEYANCLLYTSLRILLQSYLWISLKKIKLYIERFLKMSCNFYTYIAGHMLVFRITFWWEGIIGLGSLGFNAYFLPSEKWEENSEWQSYCREQSLLPASQCSSLLTGCEKGCSGFVLKGRDPWLWISMCIIGPLSAVTYLVLLPAWALIMMWKLYYPLQQLTLFCHLLFRPITLSDLSSRPKLPSSASVYQVMLLFKYFSGWC